MSVLPERAASQGVKSCVADALSSAPPCTLGTVPAAFQRQWRGRRSCTRAGWSRFALSVSVFLFAHLAQGASDFPAVSRQAVQVGAPERTVLQAAAQAGSRLVVVGERGVIALSDDDGAHWRQAKSVPTSITLTALQFVDAKTGWAVGHGGVILKTEDGGETWVRQADGQTLVASALAVAQARVDQFPEDEKAQRVVNSIGLMKEDGPVQPLLDLKFVDAKHGFAVGAYSLFFETKDGGATWSSAMDRLDNPRSLHLYAISVDLPYVYIAGEEGLLLRSQDAGQTFEALPSPYPGSWFSLAVAPGGALVVAGLRGNAFYSEDHGDHWARIAGAAPVSFINATTLADGSVMLASQAGQLLTSRRGETLQNPGLPQLPTLTGVLVLPSGGLLAVGATGAVRVPAMQTAVSRGKQ